MKRLIIIILILQLAGQAFANRAYPKGWLKPSEFDLVIPHDYFKTMTYMANLSGDDFDMLMLGLAYNSTGEAFGGDEGKAISCFLKVANAGEPHAMFQLYKLYSDKSFLNKQFKHADNPSNKKNALKWLRKSASNNYSLAQYELATLYDHSNSKKDFLEQNEELAKYWYKRAAENGYLKAQEKI